MGTKPDPLDLADVNPKAWAASLTPAQIVEQLRRLADNVYCMNADERRAILTVAATDLEGARR